MSNAGFEYRNKNGETPFETFLRYTDEKEKSAEKLAEVTKRHIQPGSRLLDVGTGNGEYLELTLAKANVPEGVQLTLVEPSADLVAQLEKRFEKRMPAADFKVLSTSLQDLATEERFDVILMSHLFYHVPRPTWTGELSKALSLLKPEGVLIIVLREEDDAYAFKNAFKPVLFENFAEALTIDDVLEALPKDVKLKQTKYLAASELRLPRQNREDTISIIEFYLNKTWDEMPGEVQQGALQFIEEHKGVFKQLDGIAAIQLQDAS
jgi:SAM-dependent methyltransferase